MIMAVCMMSISVSAANYNLHYQRYATNNVTSQYLSVGTAVHSGKVYVENNCTTLNYASKVKTTIQAQCSAPQGFQYYSITSIENISSGDYNYTIGTFSYVTKGSSLRNYVELFYDSSSYYTQSAVGTTDGH